jgi:hypothetical protein
MRKTLSILLLCVGLAGCTTVYLPNGEKYLTTASRHVVVNNTGFRLDVSQDGLPVTTLETGQSISLTPHWLVPKALVVVIAHDAQGNYAGTDNYTFLSSTAEVWQVDSVRRPQESH